MSATTCPSCNTSVPPGAIFCDNCGYDLRAVNTSAQETLPPTHHVSQTEGEIKCPNCGYGNIAGSAFCENCGTQLAQKAPPPPTPPPTSPQAPETAPPQDAPEPPSEAHVVSPPTPPRVERPQPAPAPAPSPDFISGYFVIAAAGTTISVPQGKREIIIGREDPVSGIFPEIDLDQHGGQEAGVGRMHARIFVESSQLLIEDLDSVNGTVVNRQKLAPHKPHPIKDGDEIRLGMMVLTYRNS